MKPGTRLQRGLRATYIGLVVSAILAVVKLTAGVLGHSQALIADGVESLADLFGSIVVWRGLVVAAAPADEEHPYGHGKAEPIAAAIVAGILLVAAGSIIIQSVQEILAPHRGPEAFTLPVLLAVVAIKEGLFRFVLREGGIVESSVMETDAWHHRSDAITSFAAAVGISISVIGGAGYEMADDIAAVLAAGIIGWNGLRLMRPALSELMDTTPDRSINEKIRSIALGTAGVDEVEKCIVRKMGYHYFVDMHVEVDPHMTVLEAHGIAHQVKDQIKEQIPKVLDVLVHVEPRT